ncbi:hypothetical protein COO60DRAFT_1697938 [Scenedesmus sp. NREL 46B-D3]|nr:hypothetical protein COO60DRAFT_1697938 [Scenedesmus sp. NREL 46B-D3]
MGLTATTAAAIKQLAAQEAEQLAPLEAAHPALRALPNKANLRGNQAELQEVSAALRQATKQLCRNLKDNPNVAENMAKCAAQREALQGLLGCTLDSLDLSRTVQPVLEAVMTAQQAEAIMHEMIEAEKTATALVKALKADLASEKQQHEERVREQRREVAALKEQLRQEKLTTAVEGRFHKKGLAATNQATRRQQHCTLDDMEVQLGLLQQQMEIERSVHSAVSEFLGSKAGQLQEDAGGWHGRREEDGRTKERALEVLRATHAHDLERLAEAGARLKDELAAKAARDAKAEEEAEEEAAEKALRERQLAAVITIQAAWRGCKIEAAHSALMMSALSARMKGKAVSRSVAYADTEPLFPWRPKRWDATPKVILIVGAMQMAMAAYGFQAPNMSKVIGAMLIGIAGNVLKQNAIMPPPRTPAWRQRRRQAGQAATLCVARCWVLARPSSACCWRAARSTSPRLPAV